MRYSAGGLPVFSRDDLSEFSHLVATRQGLWVVSPQRSLKFATGAYFGITRAARSIFAFERNGASSLTERSGRILRFCFDEDAQFALSVEVVLEGLDSRCHQIDLVDECLHIVDTHHQQVLVHTVGGQQVSTLHPVSFAEDTPQDGRYVHLNGFTARGNDRWYMLHNGGRFPSELLHTDKNLALVARIPLEATGCHDVVPLDDGDLLYCASAQGLLASTRGRRTAMIPGLMTRGLSVSPTQIVVGSSLFGPRHVRPGLPGAVSFLDRDCRLIGRVALPGSPTDILALRGADLSLSS